MAKANLASCGVYCIRNLISGRVYVGSSVNIPARWKSHRCNLNAGTHPGRALQNSWLKHGKEAFEFAILAAVHRQDDLIAAEQFWIDRLDAANPLTGFNVSPTAGNCLGVRHSDETKAKLSRARKGVPKSPEHRKAIGDAHRGRTIPEERRQRVAEGVRRHFAEHPEARERMREVGHHSGLLTKGRKMSADVRKAISLRRTSDEKYAEISRANLSMVTTQGRAAGALKRGLIQVGRARLEHRKLSFEQAEEVRALKSQGWTYEKLKHRFGLDRSNLCNIVKRRTYQNR